MPRRVAGMSPEAEAKFLEGIAYIAERNPSAAEKIVAKMRSLRERLIDFPNIGVRGEIPGTRRIVLNPFVLTVRQGKRGVQIAAVRRDVDALHAPRLAGFPRQVVFDMRGDRQPAQHRVAELMAAELPRRRHHPAHTELRAQFLRVSAGGGSRADHFLQRHDIGVDRAQDLRDPLGARASVDSAAAMHVVGRNAERLAP